MSPASNAAAAAASDLSASLDLADKAATQAARAGPDHAVSHSHRLSLRHYPEDCPKLRVQWYFATDVPKRKAAYTGNTVKDEKPAAAPKKYLPFSAKDSRAIETAFQSMSLESERVEKSQLSSSAESGDLSVVNKNESSTSTQTEETLAESMAENAPSVKVPVNEDYLFDVDIPKRELAPAYWIGNVYDVRRGSWFYTDGSNLRPCEENLANQLEEGYIKTRPWINQVQQRSASQPRPPTVPASSNPVTRKPSVESLGGGGDAAASEAEGIKSRKTSLSQSTLSYRLFGAYMNSMVTYENSSTAWMVTDDFLSRMTGTMYQRFAGGAHFSGTKVVRGYSEPAKKKSKESKPSTSNSDSAQRTSRAAKRRSAPAGSSADINASPARGSEHSPAPTETPEPESEPRLRGPVRALQRQLSSLTAQDPEAQEEEARKRDEEEIIEDYKEAEGDDQAREIEHLILVTHGIGQRLGARFESFNFIHDVNEFRKTLKAVYASSEDLQALNSELDDLPKNCRIQVLPICWRHLLDFPKQSVRNSRKEQDLGDVDGDEEIQYPSLEDITIEGVAALRTVVADLALDVLLYQTPVYRNHISSIVARECNTTYHLFKKRNPHFNGKVSLVGHSLGSAIMFDILADQQQEYATTEKAKTKSRRADELNLNLDFDVENFIALGSPLGLFQMLAGRTIASRTIINPNKVTLDGSTDEIESPWEGSIYATHKSKKSKGSNKSIPQSSGASHLDPSVSAPKCQQLFNIFHPSDPISYRLEPLISPAMASLKPQQLPYTKKGIFGVQVGQGITGIPTRVGQSFSGLWSSFSTGIATSLLSKSLGISAEDAARMTQPAPAAAAAVAAAALADQSQPPMSVGAGTNIGAGVIPPNNMTAEDNASLAAAVTAAEVASRNPLKADQENVSKVIAGEGDQVQHPATLIDGEMETLWGGFQKRSLSAQATDSSHFGERPDAWAEADARGRRLRREEAKVRALNRNGRVDYAIQEGAFDISFIQSIASHLSYWWSEDLVHFLIGQVIARERIVKK